ncbi:hypothetical protein ONV78_29575 [Hahella sp. CR1]|uniref:hypothetical protein n=1 Tax=Hahella sp. CR1 TaxID=2992807 RepID=UPI002440F179|nr:hypothetical protein [Hahella sp. CR1]MDG9671920.1 hypothetical protein [Hahella sp. CR1]
MQGRTFLSGITKFTLISMLTFGAYAEEVVLFQTQLTSKGQVSPNHFPADWTRPATSEYNTVGYIRSSSSDTKVLRKAVFKLDAAPFSEIKNAGVDVCIFIHPASYGQYEDKLTVTQNEAVCFNQHKGDGPQWPKSTVEINFPGQGLLIPKDSIVACDSQGSLPVGANDNGQFQLFSNFTCELFMADYNPSDAASPAYQSVRAPFFDESFVYTPHSRTAYHQNLSNQELKINGVWAYDNTNGAESEICIAKGGQTVCDSRQFEGNDYTTRSDFFAYQETWKKGESLTATCSSYDEQGSPKYCSFYFMVEVPGQNGLDRRSTISHEQADAYCNNPYPSNYVLSHHSYSDYQRCMNVLN